MSGQVSAEALKTAAAVQRAEQFRNFALNRPSGSEITVDNYDNSGGGEGFLTEEFVDPFRPSPQAKRAPLAHFQLCHLIMQEMQHLKRKINEHDHRAESLERHGDQNSGFLRRVIRRYCTGRTSIIGSE